MGKLPSEYVAIVATIDPDQYSTGSQDSDWVNMEEFHEVMAVVQAGVIAASGTIDASVRQATSSTGAGAKAITGKAITQLTTGDNDKQAVINVRTDELDVAGGFSFVSLRQTLTTAGGDMSGVVLGMGCRHAPADDYDLASVAEILA